ncbi:hypothetical protein E2C01_093267 [Portunus trituberculatus]|uniref:Uncharacterized protein n=1 Tax=Portunus trituberculatus TaxID=210409 RepID=A0A5B7JU14_PORTR|nr:hypothetical protein [Portunus trituberculatus]
MVTPSIGYLKKNLNMFSPPLPAKLRNTPILTQVAFPAACTNQDCSNKTEYVWDIKVACTGHLQVAGEPVSQTCSWPIGLAWSASS